MKKLFALLFVGLFAVGVAAPGVASEVTVKGGITTYSVPRCCL